MSAAEKIAPTVTEPLTWAEICERYPDEWVCLVEIEHEPPPGIAIRSARIAGHGKTRKQSLERVDVLWETYPVFGHFFTGRIKPPFPCFPRIVMTDEIRELVRIRR
ncbi:MAG TPA: hypothetical protein VF469_39975 [Kofleriaceae bacterium]